MVKAYAKCGRKKKYLPNLHIFYSKAAVYIRLLWRYELELKNYYSKIFYLLTYLFCVWQLWLSAAVCSVCKNIWCWREDIPFFLLKRKTLAVLAMHSYAYILSSTHPISQSLFSSTDLAGSKRQSCAFTGEVPYLYWSQYWYSNCGPDMAAVQGDDIYIIKKKKFSPKMHWIQLWLYRERVQSCVFLIGIRLIFRRSSKDFCFKS